MKVQIFLLAAVLGVILAVCSALPGGYTHEKVRIHVPTKIKTIYKTHVVKVPEHHHHVHEKIKEVPKYIVVPEKKHHHHHEEEHSFSEHDFSDSHHF